MASNIPHTLLLLQKVFHGFLIPIICNLIIDDLNVRFLTDITESDIRGCVIQQILDILNITGFLVITPREGVSHGLRTNGL